MVITLLMDDLSSQPVTCQRHIFRLKLANLQRPSLHSNSHSSINISSVNEYGICFQGDLPWRHSPQTPSLRFLPTSKLFHSPSLNFHSGLPFLTRMPTHLPYLPAVFSCRLSLIIIKVYFLNAPRSVYLVDFSCLKPPSSCRVPFSTLIKNATLLNIFDSDSICFMANTLKSSGQSEETCLPPALQFIPPKTHQQECINEVHMVLFPIMDDLLNKTHLSPRDIDILIVNCSDFCPSPSLCSIVINKYSMRSDINSYNLSGMGCSASAVAVHLAENLLQVYENSNAVVLSTENLSNGWYAGKEPSKLILNCLFRMGSAAILLTNRKEAKESSKYKLFKTLRTQRAFDDKSYLSAIREEDMDGKLGVTLTQDLPQVAGETLQSNISILGSSILPLSEKLRYGLSRIRKRFVDKSEELYVTNFKSVIQHFCLPVSGLKVIRAVGKVLKLNDKGMEAALMSLHRFGNQSSSSLWYELAYLEAKERVEKGDSVASWDGHWAQMC